jgi:hypothetical protein
MPRGDPLIRLDPEMLIQFWCFGVFRVMFLNNPFGHPRAVITKYKTSQYFWEIEGWDPAGSFRRSYLGGAMGRYGLRFKV